MKFYVNCINNLTDYTRVQVFNSARRKILLYHFGADEKILDRYFIENYHISLRLLCIQILFKTRFYSDFAEKIVLDTGKKWDNLARLITYGNGIMHGSQILVAALNK